MTTSLRRVSGPNPQSSMAIWARQYSRSARSRWARECENCPLERAAKQSDAGTSRRHRPARAGEPKDTCDPVRNFCTPRHVANHIPQQKWNQLCSRSARRRQSAISPTWSFDRAMARLSGTKRSAACVNVRTDDQYSKKDAQRRAEAALRATFNTPPIGPLSPSLAGEKIHSTGWSAG
jgi:hypothetical protein